LTVVDEAVAAAARRSAEDELCRRGILWWMLDANQLGLYRAVKECAARLFVIEAARKLGKSYLLCLIAFEIALRNDNGRINYAAPTVKEAGEITLPIMSMLRDRLPEDVRPTWKAAEGHWLFPNGAYVVLFGADDQAAADRGRGPEAVANIVDEAGFVPVLQYLISSVLNPQTLQTSGPTILGSTPPKTPGHEFVTIAENAAARGAYQNRDIYCHGRMTREQIDEFLTEEAAQRGQTLEQFKETSDYKREYGAQRVLDAQLAVVPEFPGLEAQCCIPNTRPPFYDLFISCDPGFGDLTGILFAVADFQRQTLCIEHELLLQQANTETIAKLVTQVLQEHYTDFRQYLPDAPGDIGLDPARYQQNRPFISAVIDNAVPIVVGDLWSMHKLSFGLAMKDHSEAAISAMRVELVAKRIEINPRCEHLRRQLRTAIRTKPGGDMARSSRDGHYDLVAAMKYLVRDWQGLRTHNPFPTDYGYNRHTHARREVPKQPNALAAAVLAGTNLGKARW
jgi:hypothetical protein